MKLVESFYETVLAVIKTPKVFFKEVSKEKTLKPAIVYLLILLFFGTLLKSLSDVFLQTYFLEGVANYFKIEYTRPVLSAETIIYYIIIASLTMVLLVGPIYSFVATIALHIWIKLFRGKSNLKQTAKLYIYAMTPVFLFNWVPVIGFASWFYAAYLLVVGSENLHSIPRKRAIIMFAVPMAIFALFTILGIATTIQSLQSYSAE